MFVLYLRRPKNPEIIRARSRLWGNRPSISSKPVLVTKPMNEPITSGLPVIRQESGFQADLAIYQQLT
jgi:hypothetical protein